MYKELPVNPNYGAQSVVISGGYEDDEDHREWFLHRKVKERSCITLIETLSSQRHVLLGYWQKGESRSTAIKPPQHHRLDSPSKYIIC
ncbi:hypothetical protein ACET3Z_026826 [Daucus carota]